MLGKGEKSEGGCCLACNACIFVHVSSRSSTRFYSCKIASTVLFIVCVLLLQVQGAQYAQAAPVVWDFPVPSCASLLDKAPHFRKLIQQSLPAISYIDPPPHTPDSCQTPPGAGVWFRAHTIDKAKQLGLVGWCMNTRHGSVKGEIQGAKPNVEHMKVGGSLGVGPVLCREYVCRGQGELAREGPDSRP